MKSAAIRNAAPEVNSVDHGVREMLSTKLQINGHDIPGVVALGELGFDSLALSDLAEAVEEKFGVQVPNRMLPATLTINQLVALVRRAEEYQERGPVLVEPAD